MAAILLQPSIPKRPSVSQFQMAPTQSLWRTSVVPKVAVAFPRPLTEAAPESGTDPCSYTPSGSFSSSTANPGPFHRIVPSGPGISAGTFFGYGPGQVGTPFTLTLTFTFSGPSVILQPNRTDFTSFFNVSTSSTNLPVNVRGTVNLVVGGNCVWCEAFSGSGVSSGTIKGTGGTNDNPNIRASFSAETVPEPSTWAMAVSGVSLLALLRARRQKLLEIGIVAKVM